MWLHDYLVWSQWGGKELEPESPGEVFSPPRQKFARFGINTGSVTGALEEVLEGAALFTGAEREQARPGRDHRVRVGIELDSA